MNSLPRYGRALREDAPKPLLWQVLHHVQDAKLSSCLPKKARNAAMQKLRKRAPVLQAFELDSSGGE